MRQKVINRHQLKYNKINLKKKILQNRKRSPHSNRRAQNVATKCLHLTSHCFYMFNFIFVISKKYNQQQFFIRQLTHTYTCSDKHQRQNKIGALINNLTTKGKTKYRHAYK